MPFFTTFSPFPMSPFSLLFRSQRGTQLPGPRAQMGLIGGKGTGQERPAPIASKLVLTIHVPTPAQLGLECEPALQSLKLKRHRLAEPGERVLKLREEVTQFLLPDRTVELSGEAVGP